LRLTKKRYKITAQHKMKGKSRMQTFTLPSGTLLVIEGRVEDIFLRAGKALEQMETKPSVSQAPRKVTKNGKGIKSVSKRLRQIARRV